LAQREDRCLEITIAEPIRASQVGGTARGNEPLGQVVSLLGRVVHPNYFPAKQIAYGAKLAEFHDHRSIPVESQGHSSFDEHVGSGLWRKGSLICWIVCGSELFFQAGFIIRSKQHHDCLCNVKPFLQYLASVRRCFSRFSDDLRSFQRVKADCPQECENSFTGCVVPPLDDEHLAIIACRCCGCLLSGLSAWAYINHVATLLTSQSLFSDGESDVLEVASPPSGFEKALFLQFFEDGNKVGYVDFAESSRRYGHHPACPS
jgi:hypothetical protein